MMNSNSVCLFFCVYGEFLIHGCSLNEAESYGDFLNYPDSHFEIWEKNYEEYYGVDFDFFPRGRVAYCKSENRFWIYYDKCIEDKVICLIDEYYDKEVSLKYDEHYQCHSCNQEYNF